MDNMIENENIHQTIMFLKPGEKLLLSVAEASLYTGISEPTIRKLIDGNPRASWLMHIGRNIKIKRVPFECFIEKLSDI